MSLWPIRANSDARATRLAQRIAYIAKAGHQQHHRSQHGRYGEVHPVRRNHPDNWAGGLVGPHNQRPTSGRGTF